MEKWKNFSHMAGRTQNCTLSSSAPVTSCWRHGCKRKRQEWKRVCRSTYALLI